MSAPVPDFDQLLSDHLDDRLDETQTQMLRESLRKDPALRSQFSAMQSDRIAMREIFSTPSAPSPGLPRGFSKRVLAESRRRRLNTNAPAEPVLLNDSHRGVRRRLVAGGLITAASLLIVFSLSQFGRGPSDTTPTVAQNQTDSELLAERSVQSPASVSLAEQKNKVQPLVASAEPGAQSARPAAPDSSARNAKLMDISPKPSRDTVASADLPADDDLAGAAQDRMPSVSMSDDEKKPLLDAAFTGAMMVYDVRLTSEGRERGVVTKTIQRNGLGDAHRQPIDRDVIAAAKQANTFDEDAQYQVIYLQAPAKKVDRVFLDLLKDRQQVESVGLALVTDTPLLQVAGRAVQVDPTQVQHDRPLSLELGGSGENGAELETLRELLGEQAFMPLSEPDNLENASDTEALSNSGNDVLTRVLILVR